MRIINNFFLCGNKVKLVNEKFITYLLVGQLLPGFQTISLSQIKKEKMTKRNQRQRTCLLSENLSFILFLWKCMCLISHLKSRRINSSLFSCLFCFLAFLNKNESSHREIEKVPSPDAIPSKLYCWNVAGDCTVFLPGLKMSHISVIFLSSAWVKYRSTRIFL